MSALRVTRVRVNQAGVRRMLGAPFMVREMDRRMQKARLLAIAIAPVDSGTYLLRFLREGAVESGRNERGVAFARLSNDARSEPSARWPSGYCYAYALEVGNSKIKAQKILRRALRAVGD